MSAIQFSYDPWKWITDLYSEIEIMGSKYYGSISVYSSKFNFCYGEKIMKFMKFSPGKSFWLWLIPIIIQCPKSYYFYSKHEGPAKLFDESEERARLQERQKLFKDYRTKRQAVMQVRNADREQRNLAKIKQLEQAEQWQVYLRIFRSKESKKLGSAGGLVYYTYTRKLLYSIHLWYNIETTIVLYSVFTTYCRLTLTSYGTSWTLVVKL